MVTILVCSHDTSGIHKGTVHTTIYVNSSVSGYVTEMKSLSYTPPFQIFWHSYSWFLWPLFRQAIHPVRALFLLQQTWQSSLLACDLWMHFPKLFDTAVLPRIVSSFGLMCGIAMPKCATAGWYTWLFFWLHRNLRPRLLCVPPLSCLSASPWIVPGSKTKIFRHFLFEYILDLKATVEVHIGRRAAWASFHARTGVNKNKLFCVMQFGCFTLTYLAPSLCGTDYWLRHRQVPRQMTACSACKQTRNSAKGKTFLVVPIGNLAVRR